MILYPSNKILEHSPRVTRRFFSIRRVASRVVHDVGYKEYESKNLPANTNNGYMTDINFILYLLGTVSEIIVLPPVISVRRGMRISKGRYHGPPAGGSKAHQ
jgi:hypothetical protein